MINNFLFANNKLKIRIFSLLLAVLLALLSIVGYRVNKVAAASSPSGTLTVMMHEGEDTMKPFNDAFMQKYPNIKVEYKVLADYENSISDLIAKDQFGDVIFMPSYVDADTLQSKFEPLGRYNELSEKYNFVDRGAQIDGSVYSIPSTAYLSGIIYNKEVFDKAGISETPKSIEEFYRDMELIKENTDAIPISSFYSTDWALFNWTNFPYIEMTGDASYKAKGFLKETEPFSMEGTHYKVYKLLYDLIQNELCEDPMGQLDWDATIEMLSKGQVGCAVLGSWALHSVLATGVDKDSIGFMPFPNQINDRQYVTVLTDYCIGVNKKCSSMEAAMAYVDFLLNESGYAITQDRISVVPSDPLPENYDGLEDVVMLTQGAYSTASYERYLALNQAIDPSSSASIKRIMEAAAGKTNESFEKIMEDWNSKWSSVALEDNLDFSSDDTQTEFRGEGDILFSSVEKAYIAQNPLIRVGYLKEMAPFQYEEDGQLCGLSRDIIDSICEQTGLEAKFIKYQNTDQLVEALNKGEIDLAAGIAKSKVYDKSINYSKSYISYSDVIISLYGLDNSKLNRERQAVITGDNISEDELDAEEIVYADSINSILKLILDKKVDYAIANSYSAEYYINALGDNTLATLPMSNRKELCIAFSKDVEYKLISICNKCIYEIPDVTIHSNLINYMTENTGKITLSRIISQYPLTSILVIVFICAIIIAIYAIFARERRRNATNQALAMKKYEVLSNLMDEYIFTYMPDKNQLQLDEKFSRLCGLSGILDLNDNLSDNRLVSVILENCKKAVGDSYISEPFELIDLENQSNFYRMSIFRVGEKGLFKQQIGKIVLQEHSDIEVFTGLYNRAGFLRQYNKYYEDKAYEKGVVFAILDLDNFKSVNDELGHNGGDMALLLLADELKKLKRDGVIVARYGGDEFIICVFDITLEKANELFGGLVKNMNQTIEHGGKSKEISISLGAYYTKDEQSCYDLFNKADIVLYRVKAAGKNNYNISTD